MNKINNLLLVAILFGGLGLSFTVLAKYEQKNRVKISSMEDTKAIASVNNFNVTQEEKKDTTQTLTTALPSDRKSTRLNSSHSQQSRMPSSA